MYNHLEVDIIWGISGIDLGYVQDHILSALGWLCIRTDIYIHMYIFICIDLCVHMYLHVYIHQYTYIYIYIYIFFCIHMYDGWMVRMVCFHICLHIP